jgi:hypothetical protein
MPKLTLTMRALLEARQGADSVPIVGIRQARAAHSLAARYESQSRLVSGTYYNHFTRAYATRAVRADIGGILYFNA